MITSAKNYTKKTNKNTNKKQKQTGRTLGQMVKAKLYRQNHTKKYTHTHSQKEKKEYIYIYIIYILYIYYIYIYIKKRATKSINKSTSDNKL